MLLLTKGTQFRALLHLKNKQRIMRPANQMMIPPDNFPCTGHINISLMLHYFIHTLCYYRHTSSNDEGNIFLRICGGQSVLSSCHFISWFGNSLRFVIKVLHFYIAEISTDLIKSDTDFKIHVF